MTRRPSRSVAATLLLCAFLVLGCDRQEAVPLGADAGVSVSVLPELIRGLKLREPDTRARSAVEIGRMGPAAKEAVPALIETLKDRDLSVRAAAVYSLGQIGPDAKSALPELEPLTRQAPLREVATKAIKQIREHN